MSDKDKQVALLNAVREQLDRRIAWWQAQTSDPHNINLPVRIALQEMALAISDAISIAVNDQIGKEAHE